MIRRRLYTTLHIDTNLINARQKLPAVNQLEKWFEDKVISITISATARNEALAANYVPITRKVNNQIYTTTQPVDCSDSLYLKIEPALFPKGAQNENQRNDVRIVCEAAKYAAILVTGDGGSKTQPGGIIGNRDKLRDIVQIFTPDEAVSFVQKKIKERDDFNIQIANEFGYELPSWTYTD